MDEREVQGVKDRQLRYGGRWGARDPGTTDGMDPNELFSQQAPLLKRGVATNRTVLPWIRTLPKWTVTFSRRAQMHGTGCFKGHPSGQFYVLI